MRQEKRRRNAAEVSGPSNAFSTRKSDRYPVVSLDEAQELRATREDSRDWFNAALIQRDPLRLAVWQILEGERPEGHTLANVLRTWDFGVDDQMVLERQRVLVGHLADRLEKKAGPGRPRKGAEERLREQDSLAMTKWLVHRACLAAGVRSPGEAASRIVAQYNGLKAATVQRTSQGARMHLLGKDAATFATSVERDRAIEEASRLTGIPLQEELRRLPRKVRSFISKGRSGDASAKKLSRK